MATASSPTPRGPSSPRAAGNLSPRFDGPNRGAHGPTWENTFITKPEGYEKARANAQRFGCSWLTLCSPQFVKFNRSEVSAIIQQKLRNRLEGTEYAAETAAAVRPQKSGLRRAPHSAAPRRGSCVAVSHTRAAAGCLRYITARPGSCVSRLRGCAPALR